MLVGSSRSCLSTGPCQPLQRPFQGPPTKLGSLETMTVVFRHSARQTFGMTVTRGTNATNSNPNMPTNDHSVPLRATQGH